MDGSNSMLRPKTMDTYDIYKFFGFEQSRSIESSESMEEFNEDDIWGVTLDAETKQEGFQENVSNGLEENIVGKEGTRLIHKNHGGNNKRRKQCSSAPVNVSNGLEENIVGKEGTRLIHKNHGGNNKRRKQCSSAPVNIPDLCEMIREERKDIGNFWKKTRGIISDNGSSSDDNNGDYYGNMIPPHEMIAMQLRRNEITSLPEFEGVGKTLKCRDAIWAMTGFIA